MYCIWMILHLLDNILLWIHCCFLLFPCKHLSLNHSLCNVKNQRIVLENIFQSTQFLISKWSFLKELIFVPKIHQSDIPRAPRFAFTVEHGRTQTDKGDRQEFVEGQNWNKGQNCRAEKHFVFHSFSKLTWLLTRWTLGGCTAFSIAKQYITLQTRHHS